MSESSERAAMPPGSRVRRQSDGKLRVVPTQGAGWSDEAATIFFDTLSATCNVKRSALAAGALPQTLYSFRRRDAGFAARWDAVLEQGHAELELALVRAATDAVLPPDETSRAPLPIAPMTAADAIRVLGTHRARVEGSGRRQARLRAKPWDEVRDDIARKVEIILAAERRDAAAGAPEPDATGPDEG